MHRARTAPVARPADVEDMDLTWWDIAPTIVAGLGGVLGMHLADALLARLRARR